MVISNISDCFHQYYKAGGWIILGSLYTVQKCFISKVAPLRAMPFFFFFFPPTYELSEPHFSIVAPRAPLVKDFLISSIIWSDKSAECVTTGKLNLVQCWNTVMNYCETRYARAVMSALSGTLNKALKLCILVFVRCYFDNKKQLCVCTVLVHIILLCNDNAVSCRCLIM